MDIANLKLKHQFMKGIDHIDKKLLLYINTNNHKKLAELLKIRAIHCSEIDTQKPQKNINKKFINTWSCVGLITEGIEPAEIQIGTHEKTIPFSKKNVNEILPQLIMTKKSGQEILCKSIVPLKIHKNKVEFTNITGRCIHHGEGISLNRYLGSFKYAPTMHYVYQLNPITEALLSKTSKENLVKISNDPSKWKVLNMHDDDIKGYDNVGALFIMEEDPIIGKSNKPYCFWTGSILDDKYTKNNLNDKYFGPTIIQVMAGILSGLKWMLNNKNKGLVFGEDVDDNYIIENAKKYLGKYYSGPVTGKSLDSFYLSDLIVKGHDKSNTSIHEL
jgi:homospermidine synthase